MIIKKTKYASYCLNGIAKGCEQCVLGKKLVLFVSGICSEKCWYCSLSEKRKNKNRIWANERQIENSKQGIKELVKEAEESNAKGMGITGGDPLLFLDRTIEYASALKQKYGKGFHIHIYLPTKLVDEARLKKLSGVIDEARFHPQCFCEGKKRFIKKDIEKIKLASLFWKRENIGIELALVPEMKKEILKFILLVKNYIGFVNLNEFELSDTNFNIVTKKYKLKENGYVVADSKKAGMWILRQLARQKIRLKVHLCTAELKNWHQYKNRLLRHKILPFSKRTTCGTAIYFAVKGKNKEGYYDKKKKRTIIPIRKVKKLRKKYKILKIEEYPTFERDEVERIDV